MGVKLVAKSCNRRKNACLNLGSSFHASSTPVLLVSTCMSVCSIFSRYFPVKDASLCTDVPGTYKARKGSGSSERDKDMLGYLVGCCQCIFVLFHLPFLGVCNCAITQKTSSGTRAVRPEDLRVAVLLAVPPPAALRGDVLHVHLPPHLLRLSFCAGHA